MSAFAGLPLSGWTILWLALAALTAGLTRGLAGFGGALVLVPILAAFVGPVMAVPVLNLVDMVAAAPLLPAALRRFSWRDVWPLCAGAMVATPLGVLLLTRLDPTLLRRIMAGVILVVVALLAAGWRHTRPPGRAASLGVGALSGLMAGTIGLSGPPVVLFWLGGRTDAMTVRANAMAYFAITGALAMVILWLSALMTDAVITLSLLLTPLYALGVALGALGFRYATERGFRTLALALIAGVALASLVH